MPLSFRLYAIWRNGDKTMLFVVVVVALITSVLGYALTERMGFFYAFILVMGLAVTFAESIV